MMPCNHYSLLLAVSALGLLFHSASAAVLLQDSFEYADTAAFQAAWSDSSTLSSSTPMSLNTSGGLSFTGHFPSSGGAIFSTVNNQRAYAPMTSGVQVTGALNDNSFAGQTYTLYTSYLVEFSNIAPWMQAGAGVTLSKQENNPLGVGSGWSNTDPDSDTKVQGLNLGGRVDGSWGDPGSDSNFYAGSDAFAEDVTYLILARYDITNQEVGGYSPFAAKASIEGRMAVFAEGDSLPTDEAAVGWDLSITTNSWDGDNGPFRGENAIINVVGINPNPNGDANSLWDEVRVGTEFSDVMVVPEPSVYAALVGLVALFTGLRRRRR